MTRKEWQKRYGRWIDPVRAPNGDLQVRLELVAELIDADARPPGPLGLLLEAMSWLSFGTSLAAVTGYRTQEARDRIVARFLAEATRAERTIADREEQASSPHGYRTAPAGVQLDMVEEMMPWYRRVFR